MAKKLDVEIGGEGAIRTLDVLLAKAAELEQRLQGLTSVLGSGTSGPSDRAQFFGTLEQLSGVQGAINAARSSVTAGTSINRNTLIGGVAEGTSAFGANVRNRQVADPQAIVNMAQNMGVSGSALGAVVQQLAGGSVPYMPGSSTATQVINQVVQSVQATQANPYAVLPQSGPSSPVAVAGNPANPAVARYFQGPGSQWDAANAAFIARLNQPTPGASSMMQAGIGVVAGSASAYAGGMLDYRTNQILNGGGSVVDHARTGYGAAGALIGAGLGVFAGPPGMAIGAAIGGGLLGSIGAYMAAPLQNTINGFGLQLPNAVAAGYTFGEHAPPGVSPYWRQGRFGNLATDLNRTWKDGSPFAVTTSQLAGTWATVSDGLTAGGINPYAKANSGYVYGPSAEEIATAERIARRGGGAGINAHIGAAEILVKQFGAGREQVGEMYTRRLARLFGGSADGKNLEEASKSVASIFATLPETGGNPADVLRQFGPSKTALFMRIQNEDLKSQVSLEELSRVSAASRGADRDASIGSLQARGSGTATLAALRREMEAYASLPGGDKSQIYAQTAARARDAGRLAFAQEDITAYGIPAAHLAGERERLNVLPFSPGNRFANDLRTISLDNREIGRLRGYMSKRRKAGELSEEEELGLTERIEGLETSKAYGIASLSSGMENRLPGLSAGRGRNFSSFNSLQLAQMALYKVRSPIRDFGAINGHQAQDQDEWLNGFHVHGVGPRSRTQGLNGGGGNEERLASAMNRLADAMERLSTNARVGSMSRPGDAAGQVGAAIAQRKPGNGLKGMAN